MDDGTEREWSRGNGEMRGMKEDGEVRCYLLFPSCGTRSGQRGREPSQLAARELFPRERLMSVAWATVEREPHYGAMHPGYKKVKSIIFVTCAA